MRASSAAAVCMFDGMLVEGAITIVVSFLPADDSGSRPLTASITIPRAENVLRPALRLARN